MNDIIDISANLGNDLPIWPGSCGVKISKIKTIGENSEANVSKLEMDVHTGTHIDAPLHFIENGNEVLDIDLERLIGKVKVIEIGGESIIDAKCLEQKVPYDYPKRLIIKTDNSKYNWCESAFNSSYVSLSKDAAEWIVETGIKLVGIDYLSIQKYEDSFDTHKILLENKVIILEGLDLSKVTEGDYDLICLPIKLSGAEGAPCRAILKTLLTNN